MTIDIPDELASQLPSDPGNLLEILKRGLSPGLPASSEAVHEVLAFLAQGPSSKQILSFRLSEASLQHIRDLFDKNRDNALTDNERQELEEFGRLKHLVRALKIECAGQPAVPG